MSYYEELEKFYGDKVKRGIATNSIGTELKQYDEFSYRLLSRSSSHFIKGGISCSEEFGTVNYSLALVFDTLHINKCKDSIRIKFDNKNDLIDNRCRLEINTHWINNIVIYSVEDTESILRDYFLFTYDDSSDIALECRKYKECSSNGTGNTSEHSHKH